MLRSLCVNFLGWAVQSLSLDIDRRQDKALSLQQQLLCFLSAFISLLRRNSSVLSSLINMACCLTNSLRELHSYSRSLSLSILNLGDSGPLYLSLSSRKGG